MQASPAVSIAVGKDVKTPEEMAKSKADHERFAKDVNWMYPGDSPEAVSQRASAWKAFGKQNATSGENVGDTQMPSVDADKVVHAKTPLKEVAAATHVGRVFNYEFFIAEKNIFISAAALFVLTCLIPPWQYIADRNGEYGFHTRKPAGYSLIFSPPVPENKRFFFGVGIDSSRLFLEWAVIGVVTGLVIFARQGKRTI